MTSELKEEMQRLLHEASDADRTGKDTDRRRATRFPFVYPVMVYPKSGRRQVCFSKDLSEDGIGLLQTRPLPVGTIADLELSCTGKPVITEAKLLWRREYALGWNLVGWQFMRLSQTQH